MSNISQNGEYVFSTKDPLGRIVKLKSSTWNYHVIGSINQRTELQDEEDLIKKAIENPYFILKNDPENRNSTREKYMDIVQLDAFQSLKNLIIIVDHQQNYGDVVTIIPKSGLNQ